MRFLWAVVALTACNPFKEGSISGKVESKGTLGDWVLETGPCQSGQRENFFGAVAFGPEGSGIAIKVVKDPTKGWAAVINKPETCKSGAAACKAVTVTGDGCAKFDIVVEPTNTTVNDIKVVEGKLDIECVDGNNSIKGTLNLSYCH